MTFKVGIVSVVALAIACLIVETSFTLRSGKDRVPAYSCVAGPDEQCPSDEWVKEYREWKTLQDKYSAPKDVQIKLRGYQVDLGSQVPVGYDVNEKNPMNPRFVKQKPPIAAQAPAK